MIVIQPLCFLSEITGRVVGTELDRRYIPFISWISLWSSLGLDAVQWPNTNFCGENSECTWGGNESNLVLTPSPVILGYELISIRFIDTFC